MIGKLSEIEENAVKEFNQKLRSFAGDNIKQILLFGSKARGDFHKESDIDLFVLASEVDPLLRKQAARNVTEVLLKYGVLISPKLIPEINYSNQKRLQTAFIRNIEKDGLNID